MPAASQDASSTPRAWPTWFVISAYAVLAVWLWTAAIEVLDPAFAAGFPAAETAGIALRNALPIALLSVLLWALTRRPLLSLWISGLLLSILYAVNALKLEHLETPLLPIDFDVIGRNFGGGLLLRYLPSEPTNFLTYALCALVLIGLLTESPTRFLRGRRRIAVALAGIALASTLLAGIKPWRMLYARDLLQFQSWSPSHTMEHAGLIAGLLRYRWEFSGPAAKADPIIATDLLQRHRSALSATAGIASQPPDIIVVQSESFFDPARLNGVDAAETIPNFRSLAARSTHGDLRVPAFGGGTIRTEFEVLSGLALRYFPQDEYPYFRLTSTPVPSLASVLAAHGYRTLALHPNDPAFWNRGAALSALGFAEFQSASAFADAEHDGYFVSDSALTKSILANLSDDGPPQLIFAISMGAHGPYDDSPIRDHVRRDSIPVPDGLSVRNATRLRNYLYLIGNADQALGELVEGLGQRSRRTLLLFYGDHLPALPKTYAHLGFRDGAPPTSQPVPWLLFDSAATGAQGQRVDSAAFFLPGQLLAAAGMADDAYFRLTETVREETRFQAEFTPAEDAGLAALMPLRQRGEEQALFEIARNPASTPTVDASETSSLENASSQ
jgi:phosphoglycerol transferase MdoB-like AlkP superfamily enzyme